jgi:hypothetical protein
MRKKMMKQIKDERRTSNVQHRMVKEGARSMGQGARRLV